ncbi:sulfurtransferase [Bacillus sp. ISL-45]|uniref:sulfurtransferase n=1 Tax=Bacillus sp. ISL-45 TaxID=2819128 RepID=UPI001BE8667A|nr:sulfurtransferase [Bacillus sp. ISL-45]MBT2662358.1 sulfurtransferase [Bacillus sp. ISL-45]
MRNHVDSKWLNDRLGDKDTRVVDCRFKLGNPDEGRLLYEQSHIPGAVYFDLEKDLSGSVGEHGGRHPLPETSQFKEKLQNAGIDNETTIVVYDGKEGAFASRMWWLLQYVGHEKVYILNGGFDAWKKAGYPTEESVTHYQKTNYTINENNDMLASYEEVKDIALEGNGSAILVDSRESRRYLGIEEPIDRIPGHIPTAINKPWMDGFENGFFKPRDEQEKRFKDLDFSEPIIVYCGSGVTATPNYIALKEAGFKNVRLYAGSYSDWVSYHENPVSKSE